jgi:hypothetical protein
MAGIHRARPEGAGGVVRPAFVALVAMAVAAALWAAPAMAETWVWPVRGEVATDYRDAGGPYAAGQHRGIDLAAPTGAPVVAAVGGLVRFAGPVGASGLTVSVRAAGGRLDTSYLHLSTATVRAGQAVAPGERIGTVGTSGRGSTAMPHLHFGVRAAGTRRYLDPLDFLPPRHGVRDVPRGVPIAVRGPVRVGPAPQPLRVHRFPVAAREPAPRPASRTGWAVACAALILAAALAGGGSRRRVRSAAGRLLPSFGGR